MKLKDTPVAWRLGYELYRLRVSEDSLGNEYGWYDMSRPDETVEEEAGICFQFPRGWNSAGEVGRRGERLEETGIASGGVLEGRLPLDRVINPFDRLKTPDGLWEVRAVYRWPGHRQILMQKVGEAK